MTTPKPWAERGAELQEIARRIRAGQTPAEIARALGLSAWVAQTKCREIAAALKLPTDADRRADLDRRVAPLVEQGLTDREIAERLNVSSRRVVDARVRALGPKFTIVRLTAEEHSRIDQMLVQGFNPTEIAAEIGCSPSLVSIRSRRQSRAATASPRPHCKCGKAAGHGGRCLTVISQSTIRERLLSGATCADIAREIGLDGGWFKARYGQPVITQLTAEGHRCGCGEPFGHKAMCKVTGARLKVPFSEAQVRQARELIAKGATAAGVQHALGVNANSAVTLVRRIRAELAAEGVACPCGQAIDHDYACPVRSSRARGRERFRFSPRATASMQPQRRRLVSKLARAGWSPRVVVERTGERRAAVDRLFDELGGAGLLPATCAGCAKPFQHPGPCAPTLCSCGKPVGHRGKCAGPRAVSARRRQVRTKLPDGVLAQIKQRLRAGHSGTAIGDALGVNAATVNGIIRRLREGSKYPHKPCACGRPARHPGGCIANSRQAISKLEKVRIGQGVRAGDTVHAISRRLGISTEAILRHSRPLREELFAAGVTCSCGRLVGHPQWCTAKWESFDFPSRSRSLPTGQVRAVREGLLRGDAAEDIAAVMGIGIKRIWAVRAEMSEGERSTRARMIRGRLGHGRPQGRKLMELVQAAVPHRLDAALRDDVVSELHLAVLEGRLEVEQLAAAVKSVVSRSLREWFSLRTRSIEERLGADDDFTLGGTFGDTTTEQSIDEIEIGQLPT